MESDYAEIFYQKKHEEMHYARQYALDFIKSQESDQWWDIIENSILQNNKITGLILAHLFTGSYAAANELIKQHLFTDDYIDHCVDSDTARAAELSANIRSNSDQDFN